MTIDYLDPRDFLSVLIGYMLLQRAHDPETNVEFQVKARNFEKEHTLIFAYADEDLIYYRDPKNNLKYYEVNQHDDCIVRSRITSLRIFSPIDFTYTQGDPDPHSRFDSVLYST